MVFLAYFMPVFILQKHCAALRTITVPHEHFPKSVSNVPLAEQFAENTIRWLQLVNTAYSYLCVATAKKAAEYGANTLYMDAAKAGSLFGGLAGDQVL